MPRSPTPRASPDVRDEWARRVHAEYRSAALTQHLTLWLIQIAASTDLIHDGLRIVKDELAHATLSFRTYRAAGGEALAPLTRETLALQETSPLDLELAVARTVVELFCLGETVAVPLFKVLREGCTVPVARRTLDRVLRDEVRHRDFGWTALGHLLERPTSPATRDLVARELPAMLGRLRASYGGVGTPADTAIAEEDRAWGLMAPQRYGEIVERTLERDYVPRFAEHGFDARAAWHASASLAG